MRTSADLPRPSSSRYKKYVSDERTHIAIHPIPGFFEPVSCWTHLIGAVVFVALGVMLIRRGHGHRGRMTALGVFALGSVFLLSISGTYHLLSPGPGREVLRRLDHAAIFALIASTFTAIHAVLFVGPWRWGMIVAIWTMAITGITFKTLFFHSVPEWLSLSMYIGMGWIGLVSGLKLLHRLGFAPLRLLLYGGLAYTIGAVLEYLKRPILLEGIVGPHELFHVAVLVGIFFHWRFIYAFADGKMLDLSLPVRVIPSKCP
jgi:channel protein (hemolysin III family)